jgi:hypothetical protein
LGFQCLSGDEAFTVLNWTGPLHYVLGTISLIDPQPPGALLTFWAWIRIAGHSEVAARYLSVLANGLTAAVLYAIGKRIAGRRIGLLAAFLWSINPYQIWHAQNARSYALWACFSLLSVWFLLHALRRPRHLPTWIAYTLVTAFALYTFYLETFQIIAQNLFVLLVLLSSHKRRPPCLRRWVMAQAVVVLSLVPWLFANPGLFNSGYSPTASSVVNLLDFVRTITLGENLPPPLLTSATLVAAGIVLALALVSTLRRADRHAAWLALALFLTAPLLLAGLTIITGKGYWRPHYLHASAAAYILTIAVADRKPLGKLAVVGATALSLLGLTHYYFDPAAAKANDWRALAAVLDSQTTADDLIILTYPDPALRYYYNGPADYAILPLEPNAPIEETAPQLSEALSQHRRIWLLPVESDYYDRQNTVRRWLDENAQLISERYVEQFRLREYAPWEADEDEITHFLGADLGDLAILAGYNISSVSVTPGAELTLELYWLPTRQSAASLTVFMHLLGQPRSDGSILWAQDDHPPRNWRADTTTWESGVLLRDVFHITIPLDAPAGEYTLVTGFYDPVTGERLPVDAAGSPTPNSVVITAVTVTAPQ